MANDRPLRIALGAGHRTTVLDGNPYERELNGRKTYELARELRKYPGKYDVWVYTPDDGLGLYPGNYNDAALSVAARAREGWVPDLFIELHSQGVANTAVRGSFVIYPDTSDDVDVDVRQYGNIFALKLREQTNIPAYPPQRARIAGVMSERETGVGLQGYRLGVFAATARLSATTTRLIWEGGTHSSPADRAIMDRPDFPIRHAVATRLAIDEFFTRIGRMASPSPTPTYAKPETTLQSKISGKNYLSVNGARVYRFVDTVSYKIPMTPRRYATATAPAIGPDVPPGTRIRVVAIIAQANGGKWLLGEDNGRYLLTGQEITVL